MISKESIGVEISDSHLTMAYVKATPFNTKICAHAVYGLDTESPLTRKMDIIRARVKDFLRQQRITSASIWFGLPAAMVIQRVIRLPLAAKENLGKALEYELLKYIPLEPDEIYSRYQILDEDRDQRQMKLLVAVVKKKDLAPFIELGNHLGAGICGVESAATARLNGLKWASTPVPEKAYALAYAADNSLHLSYIRDDRLQFMGALNLKDDLTYQFEKVLQELGATAASSSESESSAALKVYCCGPGLTTDLLQALNTLPRLEFRRLALSRSPIKEESQVTGTGLALKSLQRVAADINLFPEQFRKKPSVMGRYMTLALVVLTLITGLAWAGSQILHPRVTAMQVDRELSALADEIEAFGRVESQIRSLQERIDYLDNLRGGRIHSLALLKEFTEILPDTAWLRGLSYSDNKVEIEGYADSSTQLIPQLEASPLFANAKFISTITKGRDGKEVFKIGLEFRRPERTGK